jgi:hypothetical protein
LADARGRSSDTRRVRGGGVVKEIRKDMGESVRVERSYGHRGFALMVLTSADRDLGGASAGVFMEHLDGEPPVKIEANTLGPSPTAVMDDAVAQGLMDDLWNAGVRPTHAPNTEGVVGAKDAHLKDLGEQLLAATKRTDRLLEFLMMKNTTAMVVPASGLGFDHIENHGAGGGS